MKYRPESPNRVVGEDTKVLIFPIPTFLLLCTKIHFLKILIIMS